MKPSILLGCVGVYFLFLVLLFVVCGHARTCFACFSVEMGGVFLRFSSFLFLEYFETSFHSTFFCSYCMSALERSCDLLGA